MVHRAQAKTSFAIALCSHFKLTLYVISLSNSMLTDQGLESLFDAVPQRYMVLFEDIDAAGIYRQQPQTLPKADDASIDDTWHPRYQLRAPERVTLGGLLNCLDGPCSKDGRLVCITTNAPNNLDPALIRPGRIDSRIHFDYANHEVSALLLEHIFTRTADEIANGDRGITYGDGEPLTAQNITALADEFAG
jgi:chaperone BCS1